MKIINKIFLLLCFLFSTSSLLQSEDFSTPPELRGRVDFWIDIFTRYNTNQFLVHHKDFPQIVFGVMDLSGEVVGKSKREIEKLVKRRKEDNAKQVYSALKILARGEEPISQFELHVQEVMSYLPAGTEKYKHAIKEKMVRAQQGIKEKFENSLKRSQRYLHIIEDIFVNQHGLPIEITRLPFIESSFDYTAYSSVGAAGIWQFMPRTGRSFGLRISKYYDERRDVTLATKAAAKYLKNAYAALGSWPLAMTSYNHGVGGVRSKVKKMGTNNLATIIEHPTKRVFGFASNNFYPEFLAALEVYNDYRSYFPYLELDEPRHFETTRLSHSMSVSHIVNQLGTSKENLKDYNYALSKNVWSGRYKIPGGYNLNVPSEFSQNMASLKTAEPRGPTASSVYSANYSHKVRKGENLNKIAKKFGMSVNELKKINGLKSSRIYVGQVLEVEEGSYVQSTPKLSSSKKITTSIYKVRKGDTISGIATKYRISTSRLRSLNGIRGNMIRVGQKLRVTGTPTSKTSKKTKTYKVRKGDSLWGISKKFGISVSNLRSKNGIHGNKLIVGQFLKVS